MKELKTKKERLRELLKESVKKREIDGMLLSGGLDTTVLAYLAAEEKDLRAVTVGFSPAGKPDIRFSKIVSSELRLDHHLKIFDLEEMKEAMEKVVKIEETFDPIEVRNSAAIYLALEKAEKMGLNTLMTGDGADELFGGYSFLYDQSREEQAASISDMREDMSFSSERISDELEVKVELPFLSDEVISFAKELAPEYLIREENGRVWGKWIIRKAFDDLPEELIWRRKAPIEKGTGTAKINEKIDISDLKSEQKRKKIEKKEGVRLRSKTQLYCYEAYRREFGVPTPREPRKRTCPYCNTNVPPRQSYCATCGNGLEDTQDNTV